jgi:hypothetical protein
MRPHVPILPALALAALLALPAHTASAVVPPSWEREFPKTDFGVHSVPFEEILSGGPPRGGIPSIDDPQFVPLAESDIPGHEPVVGLVVDGDARAYPLRILTWHEIVNDTVGGLPVAVTYCPLCNTSVVFEREVDGVVLDFGTTGRLRHSDLVMYDRQTETWWQQFLGEAIVGELTGTWLEMVPSRLESMDSFRERAPDGQVLVPNNPRARAYGRNPYVGYDSAEAPFLFRGDLPEEVPAMSRVVRVGEEAWSLDLLREKGTIETGDLRLSWTPGQASALDAGEIAAGFDVGNVLVERRGADGWEDEVYSVDFAFAFRAFVPDGPIHTE